MRPVINQCTKITLNSDKNLQIKPLLSVNMSQVLCEANVQYYKPNK